MGIEARRAALEGAGPLLLKIDDQHGMDLAFLKAKGSSMTGSSLLAGSGTWGGATKDLLANRWVASGGGGGLMIASLAKRAASASATTAAASAIFCDSNARSYSSAAARL